MIKNARNECFCDKFLTDTCKVCAFGRGNADDHAVCIPKYGKSVFFFGKFVVLP